MPALQVPRTGLEVGVREPQVDRNCVRDVQADHTDTGHCEEGRRVAAGTLAGDVQRRRTDDSRQRNAEPYRVRWRASFLVDLVPVLRPRQGVVATERVDHAAVGRDRGETAEELPDDGDENEELRRPGADCARNESRCRVDEEGVAGIAEGDAVIEGVALLALLRQRGDHGQVHHQGGDGGDVDRTHNGLRCLGAGTLGLLTDVGRRVEAGDRVLGQQQADPEEVDGDESTAGPAGEPLRSGIERAADTTLVARRDEQDAGDDDHADHMPPHTDVTEDLHQVDTESVERAVGDQHQKEDDVDLAGGQSEVVVEHADEVADEDRQGIVDTGDDADLADQVEVTGEPGPSSVILAGQLRRPVVEATCRRVRRADLAHRHTYKEGEETDDDPAHRDDPWATGGHAEPEARHTTGEDGDD